MQNSIKKGVIFALLILASIYLTFVVDVFTLNTVLKRIFIFCYFMVICGLAIWLKIRFYNKNTNRITISCAVGSTIILLILFQNFFLPLQQETTIYLHANGANEAATGGEIWLSGLTVDGEDIVLSQLPSINNNGWTYSNEYNSYVYYPAENKDNLLELNIVAKEKIKLKFEENAWSGIVYVNALGQEKQILDLFLADDMRQTELEWQVHRSYSLGQRILLNAGIFIILTFLLENCIRFLVSCSRVK